MACSHGELAGAEGQNKRQKSHVSQLGAGNCSRGCPQKADVALSGESTSSLLPQLDSFAFTPVCSTEKRLGVAGEEREDKVRPDGNASSTAPKNYLQASTEGEEAYGGNSLKLPKVHAVVNPPPKFSHCIADGSAEDSLLQFGEVIPGACDALVDIVFQLVADTNRLTFKPPVSCVYNPLVYAQNLHIQYIRKHGGRRIEVLLVGMNPGPFGMAQTGVPFGDCNFVRTFHGLSGKVDSPEIVHPKRPVLGLNCKRSEVSGQRLWGWAQDRFGCASAFFNRFWVYNYCPLVFMEASGKNRTPDKLHPSDRAKLELVCNEALIKTVLILRPAFVVGVGKYAAIKIQDCKIEGVKVGDIMHPSPANPQANKDWGKKVEEQLVKLGVVLNM